MRKFAITVLAAVAIAFQGQTQSLIDYDNSQGLYSEGMKALNTFDYETAFEKFAQSANKGNIDATYYLSKFYLMGWGVEKNIPKALELIKYSADAGHAEACNLLADWYIWGSPDKEVNIEIDEERGLHYLIAAAEKGNADAQFSIGDLYYNGNCGLNANPEEAFKWYLKSAQQNHPTGLKRVGTRYIDGDGVEKDLDKAEEYLLRARDHGAFDIDFFLGDVAMCRKDYDTAIKLFEEFPDDPAAFFMIGHCYALLAEQNGTEDYSKAVEYWEKASEYNDPPSMFLTGACYYEGHGVEKDLNKAVDLFIRMFEDVGWEVDSDEPFLKLYGQAAKLLANCHRYGRGGLEQDLNKSEALLNFAKQIGTEDETIRQIIDNLNWHR